eukprot:6067338-Alexandrium_andersonii.AAC.1
MRSSTWMCGSRNLARRTLGVTTSLAHRGALDTTGKGDRPRRKSMFGRAGSTTHRYPQTCNT